MFEKEAEEWVRENMDCCKTDNAANQSIPYFDEEERCCAKSAFQDGAEFGYSKANEEFKICEQNADTYYDKLQKAKKIIQEFLELNYSEFIKTNAVFLHADKFLKESE